MKTIQTLFFFFFWWGILSYLTAYYFCTYTFRQFRSFILIAGLKARFMDQTKYENDRMYEGSGQLSDCNLHEICDHFTTRSIYHEIQVTNLGYDSAQSKSCMNLYSLHSFTEIEIAQCPLS